jgi:hypothetical protein
VVWIVGNLYQVLENIGCIELKRLNINFRSDKSSWKASSELLLKITGHGEDTGFQVPYLIVAAKDEQNSFTMAIQETTMVFFINLFFCTVIYIVKKSYIGCEKA